MINIRYGIVLLVVASLLLAGCGFQMRGSQQFGSQLVGQLYLEELGTVSVLQPLRNALKAQQVQFAVTRDLADTIVILSDENLSRRVASVSASGRVSEYETSAFCRSAYRAAPKPASTPGNWCWMPAICRNCKPYQWRAITPTMKTDVAGERRRRTYPAVRDAGRAGQAPGAGGFFGAEITRSSTRGAGRITLRCSVL